MILLKRNHRLFNFEKEFGATLAFDDTLLVDAGFLDKQPIGDVSCTVYTVDKIKSGDTGKRYDHKWLWSEMVRLGKATAQGAVPTDAFSLAVKKQKVLDKEEYDDSVAYFQTDVGSYDYFSNVKSAIQKLKDMGFWRPQGVGTYWYMEFLQTGENQIMKEGKTRVSAHEWVVCGWDKEHPECFKIDAHEGFYRYMPREVFNKLMHETYGSVALTLAETDQEKIDFLKEDNYSFIQALIDKLYNALRIIQSKINTLPPPVIITPKPPTPSEKLYETSKSLIGKHLTLDNSIPKDLGCAEAVSYVLKQAGYAIPPKGIPGTYSLYEWLQQNFDEIPMPEKGCIVISPTAVKIGHVGIVGQYNYMYKDDYAIMSNNSDTGLYDTVWKLKSWKSYYDKMQGLAIIYYRPK